MTAIDTLPAVPRVLKSTVMPLEPFGLAVSGDPLAFRAVIKAAVTLLASVLALAPPYGTSAVVKTIAPAWFLIVAFVVPESVTVEAAVPFVPPLRVPLAGLGTNDDVYVGGGKLVVSQVVAVVNEMLLPALPTVLAVNVIVALVELVLVTAALT